MRIVISMDIDSEVDDFTVLKEDIHNVLGSNDWVDQVGVDFSDISIQAEHTENGCSAHIVATIDRELSSEELANLGQEIDDCILGSSITESFEEPVEGRVKVEFCH